MALEGGESVERCSEHGACILVVIPRRPATTGYGGVWHFEWSAAERGWLLTSPTGQVFERTVPLRRGEIEALVGMVPGLVLGGIAGEIFRRELFPP